MKNIRVFLSENFQVLEVKFSVYLNRHVFVMDSDHAAHAQSPSGHMLSIDAFYSVK